MLCSGIYFNMVALSVADFFKLSRFGPVIAVTVFMGG